MSATRARADRVVIAVGAALFAVFAAMAYGVSTAAAEIDGPCGATINGVDVGSVDSGNRDDDITVEEGARVPVSMAAATGIASHKIEMEYAGIRWTVSEDEDDSDTQFDDTVNVDDYATYGVGLYKVIGRATLVDGTVCTGAAVVDVEGNPLATVAGGAAAGLGALATVGALGGGLAAARGRGGSLGGLQDLVEEAFKETRERVEGRPPPEPQGIDKQIEDLKDASGYREVERSPMAWIFAGDFLGCLSVIPFLFVSLLTLPFMAIGGGSTEPAPASPQAAAAPRLPRARWTPRITLLGIVCGLLAGLSALVLMQQYSIALPTRTLAIQLLVIGAVVYGLVLPTIGRTVAVLRVNGRVAEAERRLGVR